MRNVKNWWGIFLLISKALGDPIPLAHYLFEGDLQDSSENGHHAAEAGCWHSFNGDTHPDADLLSHDPQRGGVYRYSRAVELHYDLKLGGNAANSRLELFETSPFPPVPADKGITLAIWVKRDGVHQYPNTDPAEFSPVFQIGNCGNASVATLAMENDGRLTGYIEGSDPASHDQVYASSNHFVPADEWHHIAVVFDRSNDRATFYLDGLPQTNPTNISAVADGEMTFDRGIIGNLCDRSQAFCGQLDDARIYYEALTHADVETLFSANTPPILNKLETTSDFAGAGSEITLSWEAENLDGLEISPAGLLLAPDSRSLALSPTETTTYTVTATHGSARIEKKITIVVDKAPRLVEFSAEQIDLVQDAHTTLQWNIAGATGASIQPGIGTVPSKGSIKVSPNNTTTYILSASNDVGTSQHQVKVFVRPPASAKYLIDLGNDSNKAGRPGRAADDGNFWNHLNDWNSGKILSLVSTDGMTDGPIGLAVTDPFTALSPAAVEGPKAYDEKAASDGFFADAITSDGQAELTLTGLDPGGQTTYRLGFFASSPAINDVNLRQRYTVRGRFTHSLDYNPTDNTKTIATLAHLVPDPEGTLVISIEPIPGIANAIVAGLGVLELTATPVSTGITGTKISHSTSGVEITWPNLPDETYAILRSTDQKSWHQITPVGTAPFLDSTTPMGRAFYQIHKNP